MIAAGIMSTPVIAPPSVASLTSLNDDETPDMPLPSECGRFDLTITKGGQPTRAFASLVVSVDWNTRNRVC
jgi:hypothetical protein